MPTLTLSRSDVFPVGTVVGVYPPGSAQGIQPGNAPSAVAIATGTVNASGNLSITNAGIASYTTYVLAAQVGGTWYALRARSTLDIFDYGRAIGTCTTVSGSPNITAVTASSGTFAIGQRIYSPNFEASAYLISGSGAAWTVSSPASASGTGVTLEGHGGQVPAAVLGATAVPSHVRTPWQVQLRQRRQIMGTAI